MNRNDLVNLLARRTDLPPAEAADELDRLVTRILRQLRKGHSVSLPGLGVLQRTAKSGIALKVSRRKR